MLALIFLPIGNGHCNASSQRYGIQYTCVTTTYCDDYVICLITFQ